MGFVERIYEFNKANGLLEKGYDDFLESSFQIEEALEKFDLETLPNLIGGNPKEVSRQICKSLKFIGSDVDRLDKAIDAVVYAIGSMAKLGLSPSQIDAAINLVCDANEAKLGCPKDEHGKLCKPANFPNPEPKLAAILSAR